MFLSNGQYLDQVRQLVENSQQLAIAVAFWGEVRISAYRDRPFRYIVTDHFANA